MDSLLKSCVSTAFLVPTSSFNQASTLCNLEKNQASSFQIIILKTATDIAHHEYSSRAALSMNRCTHRVMSERTIWAWLNNVFNKYDKSRVDAVGPDLACAEWLLRCGAQVRWADSTKWYSDYNSLPQSPQKYKIEEIDATDSAVMTIGFSHLKGLTHLEKIRFHKCYYLDDAALAQLSYVKNSLNNLHISSCGNITDIGIANLFELSQLKKLHLFDLIGVKDRSGCLQLLTKALPNCAVTFPETPQ